MNRLVLTLGLGMLAWAGVQATEISQRHAAQLADRFYSQRAAQNGLRSAGASSLAYTFQQEGTNAIYVYNNEAQQSFVLVAGDDRVAPILGYSDQSTFDYANLPINAKAFFEQYAQEIASLRADEEEEEAKPIITFDTAVEPLLKSKWGQNDPYNLYTPAIEGKQTPSGCVATAMAQVMYYHQWPERGTGSVSYTSISNTFDASKSVNFDLSADFSQSVYQWDQMTDTYDANSTEAARQAVAKLMQDCGIAVKMNYALGGSGASNESAPYALVNYFNYDKGIRMRHAATMSDTAWVYLLKEELDAKRPMLHMGDLPMGLLGHAFVCDGYNKEGYFHINWGWNGESDGYFLLTNLAPKRHGTGGGEDGAAFNEARVVITGIQPPQSEAPVVMPYELIYHYVEFAENETAYRLTVKDAKHIDISMIVNNHGYDTFKGVLYAIPCDYETGEDCGEAQLLSTCEVEVGKVFVIDSLLSNPFAVEGLPEGRYRFRFESEDESGTRVPIVNPGDINKFVPYVTIAGGAISIQNQYLMSVSHVTFELISNKNGIPTYLVSADWTNEDNRPASLLSGLDITFKDAFVYDDEEEEIGKETIWFLKTLFQPGESKRLGRLYDFYLENEYYTYASKYAEMEPQPIVLSSERLLQFIEGKLDMEGSAALRVKLHNVAAEAREVQVVAKLFPKGAQQAVATAEGKIEPPESYSVQGTDATYTKGIGELTIPLPVGLAAGDYYALLYTDEDEPIKVADSEADARIDFTLAQATANDVIAPEAEVVRQGNLLLIQAAGEVTAVRLYDVQGRLCLTGEGFTLDLSALPTGIYFLHYQLNGVAKVKKVIR